MGLGDTVGGWGSKKCFSESQPDLVCELLSDFINLTQVHNITVSAQDIFTFRGLSVFIVSFTGICAITYADNETFCTVLLNSQVVMIQSLQPKGPEFESTCVCVFFYLYTIRLISFIIGVP